MAPSFVRTLLPRSENSPAHCRSRACDPRTQGEGESQHELGVQAGPSRCPSQALARRAGTVNSSISAASAPSQS